MAVLAAAGLVACQPTATTPAPKAAAAAPDSAPAEISETARLHAFLDDIFDRNLGRSPTRMAYLGIKKRYGEWDDFSEARFEEDLALAKGDLARMRAEFDLSALDHQGKLSYRLFEYETEQAIANYEWRFHNYPVNQMFGAHALAPTFLATIHRVDNESDAEAYISRLNGLKRVMAQVEEGIMTREKLGVVPPAFVFPRVLNDIGNIMRGAPFDESGADSVFLSDLKRKITSLEGVSEARKDELLAAGQQALISSVKPAYESLRALLTRQSKIATTDDGVWKLPDGERFYNARLAMFTTTSYDADDIHAFGLAEVARIHDEMRVIMGKVGFEGTLQEFFAFMRDDQQFYYPDDDAGREAYMKRAKEIIDNMEARLDELFVTKPKARMIVKRVEPYREKSAGKAFYNGPAPDGSRDGIYYANLYNMRDMPIYQMEALAYHEGIPGHHMQIAIAQELQELPKFRRFGGYTAYSEGWGLYAELVPKEMGLYEDPYSDFGRLAMELWRACRLVVDTGLHRKRWTREKAIEYLRQNTPNPDGDVVKAIERYIVMPGQATAYKIGMRAILDMRARAQETLGPAFDLRQFHDVVLTSGPMPHAVLGEQVDAWVARVQQGGSGALSAD